MKWYSKRNSVVIHLHQGKNDSLGQRHLLLTCAFTCKCNNSVAYLLRVLMLLVLGVWQYLDCDEKKGFSWTHSPPSFPFLHSFQVQCYQI